METYERIRELRKNHLHMTQTDFGERLGVSRSVINNIERNVLARPNQKLSLMKLICSEFHVNEDWLLNGTGPMFVQPDTFSFDDFMKSNGATDFELEMLKTYFKLDPKIRKTAMDHFKRSLAAAISANPSLLVPDTKEELDAKCPPVDTSHASGTDAG